jgi:hypothetical protein
MYVVPQVNLLFFCLILVEIGKCRTNVSKNYENVNFHNKSVR